MLIDENAYTYAEIRAALNEKHAHSLKIMKIVEDYEKMHTKETVLEDARNLYRTVNHYDKTYEVDDDDLIQWIREKGKPGYESVHCTHSLAGVLYEEKMRSFIYSQQINFLPL